MNQQGFVSVVLIVLIVALTGTLGYVTLLKKPPPTEQLEFTNTRNPQSTSSGATGHPSGTAPPIVVTNTQESNNLRACFDEGDLAENANTSHWKTFEGFGFAVQYPAESIDIQSVGNPYSGGEFSFEVASLMSLHKATITVHRLRKEIYRAPYMHSPSVVYEPHSNTWWSDDYMWEPSKFVQCNPNPRGKTRNGKYSVYSATDGDVGAFLVHYFVVLRDVELTDNYEPLVVQLRSSGNGNDPNYPAYKTFQNILENIIKTLEARPTTKG